MADPPLHTRIPSALAGQRLDQVLAVLFPDYSRSRLQIWIRAGAVRLDGMIPRPRDRVRGGESVEVVPESRREMVWGPEALPITIVYADHALLVIDKPAGCVVHPAAGNWRGTLVNALLHHVPELATVPRAGLVHRLDKDTTGLLVIARTLAAHHALTEQIKSREWIREYEAVVNGVMTGGGQVDAPLGRHPVDRKRIAVVANGRQAVTHYWVVRRFVAHTHLRLRLETGRTHQIRVHLSHLRYPLVGDPLYGGRPHLPAGASLALVNTLQQFNRQALHARRLELSHPTTGETLRCESPWPSDLAYLLECLAIG